ncbi:MAG: nucleoside phosphorylase [Phycisphaerae bacterium]
MNDLPIPLEEYDPSPALIEPASRLAPHDDMPEHCVLCMHWPIWKNLPSRQDVELLFNLNSSMGNHPVYRMAVGGRSVALAHPGLGAPLAVGLTEELIAKGARKFIATGTCGVLSSDLHRGTAVLVESALRDEGTSFHYLPPSRFADSDPRAVQAIRAELDESALPFRQVRSWTTDAFYRETPGRIRARRDEGCEVVEMELSALFALGQFRKVSIGALLWASDDIAGDSWNTRDDHSAVLTRDALFEAAIAACLRI